MREVTNIEGGGGGGDMRRSMRWAGQCCHSGTRGVGSSGWLFGAIVVCRVYEGHWVKLIKSVVEFC
jgi:hypothetical protein